MSSSAPPAAPPAPQRGEFLEIAGMTRILLSPPSVLNLLSIKQEFESPVAEVISPHVVNSIEHAYPTSDIAIEVIDAAPSSDSEIGFDCLQHEFSQTSNKENTAPKHTNRRGLKLNFKRAGEKTHQTTPTPCNNAILGHATPVQLSPSTGSSGLKVRLRGIQAALREYNESQSPESSPSSAFSCKRTREQSELITDEDTDSEIEIYAAVRQQKKAAKLEAKRMSRNVSHVAPGNKKQKTTHISHRIHDDDVMFDVGNNKDTIDSAEQQHLLIAPLMKRTARILDPTKLDHIHLLANATKAGADYYDSESEDIAGNVKDTNKPELFRNVLWGARANDYSNDGDFPTEPEFTQFVPGRFELLPNGTVSDQKSKLIVKLTDKHDRKRIFTNPPPRNWNCQEAITALNKRTVQQIRRNTNVRFREVVQAYLPVERKWILNNLTAGKPTSGWKQFVDDFNEQFHGKVAQGASAPRPFRSHSSLTKEVERFGAKFYTKGLVPVMAKKGKKE